MPLPGQSSGGWTESSSALRLLHVNVRNSISRLSDDAFTQTNPPTVATNVTTRVDRTKSGVLAGSVAFTRRDEGNAFIGGPGSAAVIAALAASAIGARSFRALGCFINSAAGNPFENTPGAASGQGPYVSSMGTFGNALYETTLIAAVGVNPSAGNAITYAPGSQLVASLNGYLMSRWNLNNAGTALVDSDVVAVTAESAVANTAGQATIIGILKMSPDSVQTELVYDQRV